MRFSEAENDSIACSTASSQIVPSSQSTETLATSDLASGSEHGIKPANRFAFARAFSEKERLLAPSTSTSDPELELELAIEVEVEVEMLDFAWPFARSFA